MTTGRVELRVRPYGDGGLLVDLDGGDRESRWRAARDLGAVLRAAPPSGVTDVVASYDSVFVVFDPLSSDPATLIDVLRSAGGTASAGSEPTVFTVPVVYGGDFGPDLELVSRDLGLTPGEVVELHTGTPWIVRLVGSPAGAPLMEGPPVPSRVPRLSTPRTRVDPGAVGMSGTQSIIYNAPSPGGWKLIGRTPLRLFDVEAPPYVAYRPGDQLRFVPLDPADWDSLAGRRLTAAEDE